MWSKISRLFSKINSDNPTNKQDLTDTVMDRGDERRRSYQDFEPQVTYDTRQAKQRASVKWLLSKSYNNKVPENIREPFYRDHEDQEHLKPQIVHKLANAELYCLALANIYSDPNYHNLNHWGIIQALVRKGVFLPESPEVQVTETVLIQTTPLKMSAHMSVIEALMELYAKEVVTPDRVVAAVQRFSHSNVEPQPTDHESALLLWVNQSCMALKRRIDQEDCGQGDRQRSPEFPVVRELKNLCDGVGLAALVSLYCPEELPCSDIIIGQNLTISECVQNMFLVYNFCNHSLPSSLFHMMPEDITYMRESMKQNLVVFLADIFNVLEIHPVKCVRFHGSERMLLKEVYPRNSQGVAHKRSLPQTITAIPDLRSGLGAHSSSFTVSPKQSPIQTSLSVKKHTQSSEEEQFVVHRGRTVPTLSSVGTSEEPLVPARLRPAKEKQNQDSKAEERGEPAAAGRPSHWEDSRRSSFAGRRSRRNSVTDDSQLTIENFGGSQENLHMIGRNPDKEVAVHIGRRTPVPESCSPAVPVRTSAQEARGSGIQLLFHDDALASEKRDEEKAVSLSQMLQHSKHETYEPDLGTKVAMSFAKMSKGNGDNTSYMQHDQETNGDDDQPPKPGILNKKPIVNNGTEKKATFAALPSNTTTWQQQSSSSQQQATADASETNDENSHLMASQLINIRMKLEEKRRRIEGEKRRIEVVMNKQRQKVGKAAFLQAISKGKGAYVKSPESEDSEKDTDGDVVENVSKLQGPFSLKDIHEDVTSVEHKWLDNNVAYMEEPKTPDIENMDMEQYQQSIAQMNSSLHDIQTDIQRLASQQSQIQDLTVQQQQFQGFVSQQQQQFQGLATQHQQQLQSLATQQQQLQNLAFQQQQMLTTQTLARSQVPPPQPQPVESAGQFYLHEDPAVVRRTWSQPAPYTHHPPVEPPHTAWSDKQPSSYVPQGGFVLHEQKPPGPGGDARYHNGGEHLQQTPPHHSLGPVNHSAYNTGFQLHPTVPPRHHVEPPVEKTRNTSISHAPIPTPPVDDMEPQSISFIGVPSSNADDHSTNIVQSIKGLQISSGSRTYRIPSPTRPAIGRNSFQQQEPLEITSVPNSSDLPHQTQGEEEMSEKGFYISFDNESQPKRPKPPLRAKRMSPKKERVTSQYESTYNEEDEVIPNQYRTYTSSDTQESRGFKDRQESRLFDDRQDSRDVIPRQESRVFSDRQELNDIKDEQKSRISSDRQKSRDFNSSRENRSSINWQEPVGISENQESKVFSSKPVSLGNIQSRLDSTVQRPRNAARQADSDTPSSGVGLVIGNELLNPEPSALDEMERKKERIMLLSLQRRQQQEEMKQIKEQEAHRRREMEKFKAEERERKKEDERQRRQEILEQYKLKKAMEEAEREGKVLPIKSDMSIKPVAKMRNKSGAGTRPRPKTIHVDSGNMDTHDGVLSPSHSKKGSTSNLTDPVFNSHSRRDYYHGSQDNLADRGDERRSVRSSLFADSPDDGRGASPCRGTSQLGRRGSYKNSRDTSEPRRISGRPKYPSYQGTSNFRGRKSNSLMNLSGSSTDADSLVYRYGDTDSGLGRATPPRRAPSPGMSSMRHLPSPSGPGSLPPGLITKRRTFDDGASDISSNPSSMMDYTGPRLYKQPTTKSNRGIMLNAVEYCVFPGVVNREAKRRVLEEISRSESKHFLILFRDAGCQFRALYSYCPDREEVFKLYGTGPKQVNDRMFDKFFKYNSGGKCFSQIHTKSLTVTIDAFTIHNSLWQGKKVALPNKKDMVLVI